MTSKPREKAQGTIGIEDMNIHQVLEYGYIMASNEDVDVLITVNGAYFNIWCGDFSGNYGNSSLIALKFGVSCNPNERHKGINSRTSYTVVLDSVYKFESVGFCRMAENTCKASMDCGIVSKSMLPDGWTETTAVENRYKIVQIYEQFGGKLV